MDYFFEKEFTFLTSDSNKIPKGEYEQCTFTKSTFSGSDLLECKFIECTFIDCEFTNTNLFKCAFQKVHFSGCKLTGLLFEHSDAFLFEVKFTKSTLQVCGFFQKIMKNTSFINSKLVEVDFTESNLTASLFEECELQHCIFDRTILENCNLSSSTGLIINPETNKIKGIKVSLQQLPGFLAQYGIDVEG